MGLKEKLGMKSPEEKIAEEVYELARGVEQTKQYLAQTKVLIDDIDGKMDEAVAGDDKEAFNELNGQYEEHNTTYQEMGSFVRELESTIMSKRGEALANSLVGLVRKYSPVASKSPKMRELLETLQKNKLIRQYMTPTPTTKIASATSLTGKAAERWAAKKKIIEDKVAESAKLEEQLEEKGVETPKTE